MSNTPNHNARAPWRNRLYVIIFQAHTPAGKAFDVALLIAIFASVTVVMAESVADIKKDYATLLDVAEWIFTVLFTIEYVLRLLSAPRPARYARSFFGLVDVLAILPTYLSLLIPGSETLLVIRGLRLLRVFRIFKLGRFIGQAALLRDALYSGRHKIIVFLSTILILVTIIGAAMYLVEGPEHGFTSIPIAVYWAIVTMTTVGYGNIAPETPAGRTLAAFVMVLGYSIIAVPTGIVTAELVDTAAKAHVSTRSCPQCDAQDHALDAKFCKHCGTALSSG